MKDTKKFIKNEKEFKDFVNKFYGFEMPLTDSKEVESYFNRVGLKYPKKFPCMALVDIHIEDDDTYVDYDVAVFSYSYKEDIESELQNIQNLLKNF